MQPWSIDWAGRLEKPVFTSEVLRNNPLGDPHERPLWVYLPPGYDHETTRRYPVIYNLIGLTGQVDMWANRMPFRPTVLELIDRLFASGDAPPCLVVFVDCWTSLGGSQYVDSPATGQYHSHLCNEIVPFIDRTYRTLAAREHRGVAGKSSGGYGAMITPMLRPDLWGGLATHAGDALFEVCYLPELRDSVRYLRNDYGGSFDRFWQDFRGRPAFSKKGDEALLDTWCMAACYSADADGTVRLPMDVNTGELFPDIWQRWLDRDPVRMVARHAADLRTLRAIYIDSGRSDEFYLDLGAEAFRRALAKVGITDVFFELFEGTHRAIEYRYPIALAYLARRLSP